MKKLQENLAWRIMSIYAGFWRAICNYHRTLTILLVTSRQATLILELLKETSFVVSSALLIYYLLHREMRRRLRGRSRISGVREEIP